MSKLYTIKDIEALTNIKAHTIRIWEQRYGIVKPKRTEGNSRRYSDDQLKHIINVAFLNKQGVKISHIAQLNDEQLSTRIKEFSQDENQHVNYLVNDLLEAIVSQDEDKMESIFKMGISEMGMEQLMCTVLKPVFVKVGMLWQTGTIGITHEHFFSNIVRSKLVSAIEQLPRPDKDNVFVLFLPDTELHELGLLYYQYILRAQGFPVVYLGQSLPIKDLKYYNYIRNFQNLLTVVTSFISEKELQNLVLDIHMSFKDVRLFISGMQLAEKNIEFPSGSFPFLDADELKRQIKHLR